MEEKDKNEMTAVELLTTVEKLIDENKDDEAITLLDDDILSKFNDADLFNNKGRAYFKKSIFDDALNYFSIAIEISSNTSHPYQREIYYHNRGISNEKLGFFDNALEDLNTSININPNYANAYIARGNANGELKNYIQSIADYDKGISLAPNKAIGYNNRGVTYEEIGEYEKALIDYEKAINIDPNYNHANENLTQLIDSRGSSLQLFIESLKNITIPPIEKSAIFRIFSAAKKDAIDKIRALAGKNIKKIVGEHVVHYTKLSVADAIATNQSKNLRYYNAIYMNDPEEGQVILDYLHKDVTSAFENANKQEEGNIYIGSFLPALQHQDELVMWRTYGKDENQVEGAGCSITINKDFFDEYADDNYINPKFVSKTTSASNVRQNLFRVLYYNKNHKQNSSKIFDCRESKKIQEYIDILNKQLLELVELKDKQEEYTDKDKAIDKIIYHLVSEIRFFFKSSDYSFENEVRVLQYTDKSSDLLIVDERAILPKKVYIESNKEIQPFIERITLGPKVPNPKQWLYLDVSMRQKNPNREKPVEFIISQRKYQ